MECFYCRSYNRKYYCSRCLTEKLSDHNDELQSITEDSQQAIKQAETFLEKASKVHALVVEKKRRSANIRQLLDNQEHTALETSKLTLQLERLQKDMNQRRHILEQSRQRLDLAKTNMNDLSLNEPNSNNNSNSNNNNNNNSSSSNNTGKAAATVSVQKSWQRTYKMTARTRQILVKEAASLFDLKPGVVEDADDDDPSTSSGLTRKISNDPHKQQQQQHPSTTISTDTPSSSASEDKGTTTDSTVTGPYTRSRRFSHVADETIINNHLQSSTLAFTKSTKVSGKAQSYEDLYICGVSLPARLIDVSRYPKDELNSAIGYTSQMLDLIVRYLGIKLPFCLFRKDIYTYIRSIPHSRLYQNQSKMPLFLENDKNFRRFLIGISMLNYNIVYLCYTQGVHIPLSQVANTLQNLLTCCNAPGLGLRSHAMIYQGLTNLDFSFDFDQVIRQTALRYRCGSRIGMRGDQQGVNGDHRQERTEKYFKVRRSAFLGDQYDDEDEDIDDEDDDTFDFTDEEDDEDDDDDDDDDEDGQINNNHKQHYHRQQRRHMIRRHQDQEEEEEEANEPHDETTSSSNENWNLVDVMPAFATQSGHNDSIFHLGATHLGATIMPGVLGMMENLGGRHGHSSSGFGDHQDDALSNYRGTSTLQKRW